MYNLKLRKYNLTKIKIKYKNIKKDLEINLFNIKLNLVLNGSRNLFLYFKNKIYIWTLVKLAIDYNINSEIFINNKLLFNFYPLFDYNFFMYLVEDSIKFYNAFSIFYNFKNINLININKFTYFFDYLKKIIEFNTSILVKNRNISRYYFNNNTIFENSSRSIIKHKEIVKKLYLIKFLRKNFFKVWYKSQMWGYRKFIRRLNWKKNNIRKKSKKYTLQFSNMYNTEFLNLKDTSWILKNTNKLQEILKKKRNWRKKKKTKIITELNKKRLFFFRRLSIITLKVVYSNCFFIIEGFKINYKTNQIKRHVFYNYSLKSGMNRWDIDETYNSFKTKRIRRQNYWYLLRKLFHKIGISLMVTKVKYLILRLISGFRRKFLFIFLKKSIRFWNKQRRWLTGVRYKFKVLMVIYMPKIAYNRPLRKQKAKRKKFKFRKKRNRKIIKLK